MARYEHNVYLTYRETSRGGEVDDPEDRWSTRAPTYIDFYVEQLFLHMTTWQETIPVCFDPNSLLGKTLYVVIVRYTTGDSFGSSHGNWKVLGAFRTYKEAEQLREMVNKNDVEGGEDARSDYTLFLDINDFYPVWQGYFERLEGVEIHAMTLEERDT